MVNCETIPPTEGTKWEASLNLGSASWFTALSPVQIKRVEYLRVNHEDNSFVALENSRFEHRWSTLEIKLSPCLYFGVYLPLTTFDCIDGVHKVHVVLFKRFKWNFVRFFLLLLHSFVDCKYCFRANDVVDNVNLEGVGIILAEMEQLVCACFNILVH